jgi:hypothetical protein
VEDMAEYKKIHHEYKQVVSAAEISVLKKINIFIYNCFSV